MARVIPADKSTHYIVGQTIFSFVVAACYLAPTGLSLWASAWIGQGVVAVFAVGKEVWDKTTGKGTPEWRDAVATQLGTVLPCTLLGIAF